MKNLCHRLAGQGGRRAEVHQGAETQSLAHRRSRQRPGRGAGRV